MKSISLISSELLKFASDYFNYMKGLETGKDNTPIHVWMVGFECGEEDVNENQWGDPYSAWYAWRGWMKKRGLWQNKLEASYEEFKAGYEKALILNKGIGVTQDPDDHEIWEDAHHPWGENRSRIRPRTL